MDQQAYLKASNTGNGDQFARSVAISGDTLVVGAHYEDSDSSGVNQESNNSLNESGAAYVFTRSDSLWSQAAYLKASNTGVGDQFGYSVAISGDTLVVGTRYEDSNSIGIDGDQDNNLAPHSGAAYVFTRSDSSWGQEAYLKASNTGLDDEFGRVVAISGNTLVVGVYNEESNSTGVNGDESNDSLEKAGAAYVFIRSPDLFWSQQAYLKASNTGDNDRFGQSIAISGDTLVVGAYYEDGTSTGVNGNENDDSAKKSGAAYVYTRSGSSWSQQAYLKASNTEKGDKFGRAVAISGDTLVMGADLEDSVGVDDGDNSVAGSGSAYVFTVIPPHILPNNQWHQISLPMDPKTKNTVADIFADDGLGTYSDEWVIYSYNGTNYDRLELTDTLSQGVGYWIIQSSGSDKTLEMPIGSATTPTTTPVGCSSTNCFSIPLLTEVGGEKFNLLGYPYGISQIFSESRIHADSPACIDSGCDLGVDGIFRNQLWSYDGSSGYEDINSANDLKPWLGYWGQTLNNADGKNPVLIIPEP